jgi:hypothetical protein
MTIRVSAWAFIRPVVWWRPKSSAQNPRGRLPSSPDAPNARSTELAWTSATCHCDTIGPHARGCFSSPPSPRLRLRGGEFWMASLAAKKRRPEEEVEEEMHLAFRGAANALSQVYSQAVAHQKASFLAGERRAMVRRPILPHRLLVYPPIGGPHRSRAAIFGLGRRLGSD